MKKSFIKKTLFFVILGILVFSIVLTSGCAKKVESKIKIGLSFDTFDIERWPRERDKIKELAEKEGAEVIWASADKDANRQNDQIENMVTQGADVIIIIAYDGASCVTAVDQAAKDGVPCIAYDRLIPTDKLAAYITFDNVEVGRQQALGVLKVTNKGNFVLLGGSPTDNNATLVRMGQMSALKPYIDSGDIKVVADQWVEGWSQEKAVGIIENILTTQQNKVDAIVSSNDGTALGAIQALEAQSLAGKVPLSGQDATGPACKAVVEGKLTVTVFKDINLLSPMAVDLALKLAKKETIDMPKRVLSELTGKSITGSVPCKFLDVVQVTKDNLYDVVIKSGFQKWEEVYKDIPEDQRPPKP
ncbi:MAG: substrate-binding domain-containing protein [Spirochaetales bacterium]|nr:substrate-binding domain-containing protein [Spirochaetales bacterium]